MMKARKHYAAALLMAGAVSVFAAGCGDKAQPVAQTPPAGSSSAPAATAPGQSPAAAQPGQSDPAKAAPAGTGGAGAASSGKPGADTAGKAAAAGGKADSEAVAANPADKAVLVNKVYKLPDSYKPQDLVDPDVPFIFKEKTEKRKLRKEAASALEKLFKAAKDDKLPLAGVSAYRSFETQKTLYANYVKTDGVEAADKYSARPGHSEHETGLAIDVTGISGKCAASDCFGGTKEAKWLEDHAADYGFIIRYPKGKEDITGYQYEPWHIRYVGVDTAKDIVKRGVTLEEYAGQTVQVTKP